MAATSVPAISKMAALCALLVLIASPVLAARGSSHQEYPGSTTPGAFAPSPGVATITAGTCPGVSFNATLLSQTANTCRGANHPVSCCLAINQLWDNAAIASPDAAQTVGQAYVDPDVEFDCLGVTAQALEGLGVHPNLVSVCQRTFRLTPVRQGPNQCPSPDLSAPQLQNVISACGPALTPDDACGPCFGAIADVAVGLLNNASGAVQAVSAAQGLPTVLAGASFAVGALQTAQDCIQLVKLRVLQSNPAIYKAFALQDAVSDIGCGPLVAARQAAGPVASSVGGAIGGSSLWTRLETFTQP